MRLWFRWAAAPVLVTVIWVALAVLNATSGDWAMVGILLSCIAIMWAAWLGQANEYARGYFRGVRDLTATLNDSRTAGELVLHVQNDPVPWGTTGPMVEATLTTEDGS